MKRPKTDKTQPLSQERPGPEPNLKSYSCLICRQRKVKCNRQIPCNNCIKSEKQCSFIPPVRGKRKKIKPVTEGLHAKVRRYEELLRSCGVEVDVAEDLNDSSSESASILDAEIDEDVERQTDNEDIAMRPKLVTKEGTSRYFDRYI
jgi:hypothetical protein